MTQMHPTADETPATTEMGDCTLMFDRENPDAWLLSDTTGSDMGMGR